MRIDVDLSDAKLLVRKGNRETDNDYNTIFLEADIVSGCDDSKTPIGEFKAGKFIKEKTNPKFGPVPWSKDPWGNPYGPYFLQILDLKGKYTTYGIHGTRGFDGMFGHFVTPPAPKGILDLFIDGDIAKYSYCSNGCIRISNSKIKKCL
jgi:hypothetical protein